MNGLDRILEYDPDGLAVVRTTTPSTRIGTLDTPAFAAITGYIAFFTLALYVAGLILLGFAMNGETTVLVTTADFEQLPEPSAVRKPILAEPRDQDV